MNDNAVAYCGRCYHDRGQRVRLTMLQARASLSRSQWEDGGPHGKPYLYGCPFCNEERALGGYHTRSHIVTTGSHQGEENVVHIPHVVML